MAALPLGYRDHPIRNLLIQHGVPSGLDPARQLRWFSAKLPPMSTVVEMFREAAAPRGRNRFACPLPIWDLLWEVGRAFGWHPKGTTYVPPAKRSAKSPVETPAPALRDYQPGGSQDHKRVEGADAVAWARALEVAKASPHLAAMIEARSVALATSGKGNRGLLPGVLDEFIEFAYGGAFEFAILSDDSGGAKPGGQA